MLKSLLTHPAWLKRLAGTKKMGEGIRRQEFDSFLVLDFEATCLKDQKINPQEVIEFPCLRLDGRTLEEVGRFHQYVRPEAHPKLTDFCVQLTGISQETVDDASTFDATFSRFVDWVKQEGLLQQRFTFVTCGDWDLKIMLPSQCQRLGIPIPSYMASWINIKKSFAHVMECYPRHLPHMLDLLELPHLGRLHSGIDDCQNIAAITKALGLKGYVFQETGSV